MLVKFSYKGDANYTLQNRKYLGSGGFVDLEYTPETERSRQILRPYWNAARKHLKFHRKCRLDGDTLIIRRLSCTKDDNHKLQEELNGFNVSSKQDEDQNVFGFFGNMNPLSNFYMCNFTYKDVKYHSSEQMIQHMKSELFNDAEATSKILSAETPLECTMLSKDIANYNRDTWYESAKDLCCGGIIKKFAQNLNLKMKLLSTGLKTIIESCYDRLWGMGIPLHDERWAQKDMWSDQGILGEMLETTQGYLSNQPTLMETTEP